MKLLLLFDASTCELIYVYDKGPDSPFKHLEHAKEFRMRGCVDLAMGKHSEDVEGKHGKASSAAEGATEVLHEH